MSQLVGPADDADLARQVAQLRLSVLQLQQIVGRIIRHPPVELHVEHMAVEHLAFNVAGIDVEELSGQLNLGLTHIFQPRAGRDRPEGATEPGPPPEAAAESLSDEGAGMIDQGAVPLWPPASGEEVEPQP